MEGLHREKCGVFRAMSPLGAHDAGPIVKNLNCVCGDDVFSTTGCRRSIGKIGKALVTAVHPGSMGRTHSHHRTESLWASDH